MASVSISCPSCSATDGVVRTNDKVFKAGLRRKMRKAAMDRNYLASVLAGSGLS
ncbi:IS1 family transposase [Escherichia coli]|uniref:IS1 family transposase n=1 Tax=Escherichia coli TaxID=562 RepID=UPI001C70725E|nr:IS1 family transposase [Escherichia coli]MBW9584698.1 transposase [Escherichia coli]